jgi:hypothetical protein
MKGYLDFYIHQQQVIVRSWPRNQHAGYTPGSRRGQLLLCWANYLLGHIHHNVRQLYKQMAGGCSWTWHDIATKHLYGNTPVLQELPFGWLSKQETWHDDNYYRFLLLTDIWEYSFRGIPSVAVHSEFWPYLKCMWSMVPPHWKFYESTRRGVTTTVGAIPYLAHQLFSARPARYIRVNGITYAIFSPGTYGFPPMGYFTFYIPTYPQFWFTTSTIPVMWWDVSKADDSDGFHVPGAGIQALSQKTFAPAGPLPMYWPDVRPGSQLPKRSYPGCPGFEVPD